MRYTTEEGGRLNNFAIEPKMYEAEPPTTKQKTLYAVLGVISAILVVGLIGVAISVS
jgi:hypothetical protein